MLIHLKLVLVMSVNLEILWMKDLGSGEEGVG
jgi:hypothetical protein